MARKESLFPLVIPLHLSLLPVSRSSLILALFFRSNLPPFAQTERNAAAALGLRTREPELEKDIATRKPTPTPQDRCSCARVA